MKKILVINLGNDREVIESSFLISSMLNQFPHNQIHFLCNKASTYSAKIISGIEKVHTLEIENIKTILNNQLYSDAFALNTISENLSEILDSTWDEVINYDNSTISAYLTSSINKEKFLGAEVYKNGNVLTSNNWAGYQNFCLENKSRLHIDNKTIKHQILGIQEVNTTKRIKLSSEFNTIATQNFQRIRSNDGLAYKFIGINIPMNNKAPLTEELLTSFIRFANTISEHKVVLIHNGSEFSQNLILNLNKAFNNTLISIHADTEAIPSVMNHLEVFLSERNHYSLIAQAMEVKTIEISDLQLNRYRYTGIANKSFLIDNTEKTLDLYDLVYTASKLTNTQDLSDEISSSPIYCVLSDDYGSLLTQVNGPIVVTDEVNYHINRALDYQILGKKINNDLIDHLKECTTQEILKRYTLSNKETLTECVKALLATLRSVKTALSSQEGMNHFLINLERLIGFNKSENICAAAVGLFEAKVENIQTTDAHENIKFIESYLFELKNDFQQVNVFLDQLISHSRSSTLQAQI